MPEIPEEWEVDTVAIRGTSTRPAIRSIRDAVSDTFDDYKLRTKEGKEVDFCLTSDDNVVEILEVKNSDANLSKNLIYFCEKYTLKGMQLVKELKREKTINDISIRRADNYLNSLFL